MKIDVAKEYAFKKFQSLSELNAQWNYFHSLGIISALEDLVKDENIDKNRLIALAWVHDIGKIEGDEDHAENSIKILSRDFKLDEVDIDCIRNHGSSGKPQTQEGRIFRYCDGLSLFYPQVVLFRFYAEGREGNSYVLTKEFMKKSYEKYLKSYSENTQVVELLKQKYSALFE